MTSRTATSCSPDSSILIVRGVYSDWSVEDRGELRIHRVETLGTVRTQG